MPSSAVVNSQQAQSTVDVESAKNVERDNLGEVAKQTSIVIKTYDDDLTATQTMQGAITVFTI